ncbi:MAG: TRAP transporter large permease [Paralcaligenes sp.]
MSVGVISLLAMFAATVLIDIPIAFGLILSSVAYLLIFDVAPLMVAAQQIVSGMDSFTLLAIPLFLLAAQLMNSAGLTKKIIHLCSAAVGDIKGGLAVVAVLASMLFGALSGSGVADVVAIGSVLLPAMYRSGYDKGFSCALLGCAGSLGVVIPPSIVMIVYGTTTNTSVGKLFLGGVIPGVLLGCSLIAVVLWQSRKQGWAGGMPFNRQVFLVALKDALPALLVPVLIIGGIRFGIFTATEAAASAIVYALFVGFFVYRQLSWRTIWKCLRDTSEVSASILLIIGAAGLFAWILIAEQVPQQLAHALTQWTSSRTAVLLLLTAGLLMLGTFMESIAIIIIVAPVVMPIIHHYGIDPVHFGIILTINLAIGANTPPLGVDLMASCRIGGISMAQSLKPLVFMLMAMISILMLLTFIPELVLYLPRHMN